MPRRLLPAQGAWGLVDRSGGLARPMCVEPPTVGRECPFGEVPATLCDLESGEGVGTVVLET